MLKPGERRVTPLRSTGFRPYELGGSALPGASWLPLGPEAETGAGCYLLRYAPGAGGPPHEHGALEEFLVLEGALIDSDGNVLRAGDFVRYEAGSRHFTHSPAGCLLLVIQRARNQPVAPEG